MPARMVFGEGVTGFAFDEVGDKVAGEDAEDQMGRGRRGRGGSF